ncbi:lamin tail domain-containing protein [Nannocystis sp. SCPEA4]|uniref:lamin tail domain-containing protein n=1 Tax=Nannocystis sp. SCPEA4 TaxID=2996787 RepID=UPI00226D59A8|nr:lamin tail domain-containing protein [Nannocystis sp. SCPEA4]MCY1059417.1 lamin tail domain-containing protein [Nannocystis sp. SCPEA4]
MIHRALSRGRTILTLITLAQTSCGGDDGGSEADASGGDTSGGGQSATAVRLNELTSKSPADGSWAGMGDAIELVNPGAVAVDLAGWKLSDDPGLAADKTYEFPAGTTIAPGGYLVLVAFDELTATGDFPFGISSTGSETISLVDAAGALVDQVAVDGVRAQVSYCRVPDAEGEWGNCLQTLGAANVVAPSTCGDGTIEAEESCDGDDLGGRACADLGFTGGTLACSPTSCRLDATRCESGLEVAINELEAIDDRIELHNAGAEAVDLSGWILTDRFGEAGYDPASDGEKLVFAVGTELAAGGYLVVGKGDLAGQHPFGLSSDGDAVTLVQADLTPVDHVTYEPQQAEISFCALPDGPGGTWRADCTPTFGAANAAP